jgi:lipopolysaccharide/colanic/teichoic acid biosynthesis glycosyltransferase
MPPAPAIPFLVPPAGRPEPPDSGAAGRVRIRLASKRVQSELRRIAGEMPRGKRLVDVVGSLVFLAAFTPLLLLVAVLIKATDGGPVLFWQRRVGFRGREFWFPKFRSMMPNANRLVRMLGDRNGHAKANTADGKTDVTFKMKDDPRLTWIGALIRKFSIDEMPQFWCVLKGDMSLVGPRPPLPTEVARYSPSDRRRLDITPGLTCIWQVSGRGDIPFPRQVEMDVDYIERQGFWFDLKLMVLTVPAVLRGRGAY